jgi:hypothetical protein
MACGRDQRGGILVEVREESRLQVSEEAKAVLASLLEGRNENDVLRLCVVDERHTLALDEVRAGDLTFQYSGRPVLVVAAEVAQDLWGQSICCQKVGTGLGIVLRRVTMAERGEAGTASLDAQAVDQRTDQHRRLLEEVNGITAQIAALRLSHSADKVARIRELEATKQARWHQIRTLWAGAHHANPNSKLSSHSQA